MSKVLFFKYFSGFPKQFQLYWRDFSDYSLLRYQSPLHGIHLPGWVYMHRLIKYFHTYVSSCFLLRFHFVGIIFQKPTQLDLSWITCPSRYTIVFLLLLQDLCSHSIYSMLIPDRIPCQFVNQQRKLCISPSWSLHISLNCMWIK